MRPPVPSDAAVFARIFDAEVMRYVGDGSVRDLAYYEAFVAQQRAFHDAAGVGLGTVTVGDLVAGFCGVHRWSAPWGPTGAWEIGWRLGRAFHGQGVAHSAARAVLDGLPGGPDGPMARRLVAVVHLDNAPSRRLALRLGLHPAERAVSPQGAPVLVHRRA